MTGTGYPERSVVVRHSEHRPPVAPLAVAIGSSLPTGTKIIQVVDEDVPASSDWVAAIVEFTQLAAGFPSGAANKPVVILARKSDVPAPPGQPVDSPH